MLSSAVDCEIGPEGAPKVVQGSFNMSRSFQGNEFVIPLCCMCFLLHGVGW